jgi:hypothetical protein
MLTMSIVSKADHFERRQLVRDTWLKHVSADPDLKRSVMYKFVVANAGPAVAARVKVESETHGDIMYLDDVAEGDDILSTKVHRFIAWSSQFHTKFHLKTDDDTYIHSHATPPGAAAGSGTALD